MHGCITSNSTTTTTIHLIAAHRAVRRVYLAASTEFDRSDDDDESYEALVVGELVSHAFDLERRVLNDLMKATPTSVAEMTMLVSYINEVCQAERDFGNDDEGRAEKLVARLAGSVRLVAAA
jgi:hypothetical protein